MNVRIFWVSAMKCMCAQTRPRFIFLSERVFGGMEFEPMLTPKEKSPLPENVPRGGSNLRRCGQRAQELPTELFRPPSCYPVKPTSPRKLSHFAGYLQHTQVGEERKNAYFLGGSVRCGEGDLAFRRLDPRLDWDSSVSASSPFAGLHRTRDVSFGNKLQVWLIYLNVLMPYHTKIGRLGHPLNFNYMVNSPFYCFPAPPPPLPLPTPTSQSPSPHEN